jgi:ATP:ADP antiporter, AAA family
MLAERFLQIGRLNSARPIVGAWLGLFLLIAAHALLETGRDALFLASLPAARLPIVYLLIAAVAVVVSSLDRRPATSPPTPQRVATWFAAAGAATVLVGGLPVAQHPLGLYALYVGSGLITALLVSRFWSMLGGRFSVPDAKRLYTLLGTATGGGAVAGYAVASALARWVAPGVLISSAGVLLAIAAAAVATVDVPGSQEPAKRSPARMFKALRGVATHRYAATVALFVGLSALAGTLVDFLFKSTVAAHIAPERLGVILGEAHLGLNVVSLLLQALVVRRVLRRGGVTTSVTVLPAGLLLGGALLVASGGLTAAFALFALDGTLRHSLHRTVVELLYVPMPESVRTAARSVVDVVSHRMGQAVAAGIVLAWAALFPGGLDASPLLVIVSILLVVVAVSLRRRYLQVFRETLREGVPARKSFPDLDIGSFESVVASLDSTDDARVVAALDLLAGEKRGQLVPSVLLYHPSEPVALRTIELMVSCKPSALVAHVNRVMRTASPAVAAALVTARSAVAPDRAWLGTLLNDESDAVRTTAAVELAARGWVSLELAMTVVERTVKLGNKANRTSLAEAIGRGGPPGFEGVLLELVDDSEPQVRAAAVRSMARLGAPSLIEPLLLRLGDRAIRDDVRDALPAMGAVALRLLQRALESDSTPAAVRDQVPRAISGFGSEQAADYLLRVLTTPIPSRVAQRIVRELERMRCVDPSLALETDAIRAAVRRALKRAFEVVHWRSVLCEGARSRPERATPVHGLLIRMLRDKETWIVDAVLRLIGLLLPGRDVDRMREGLRSDDLAVWSSSFELLESVLPQEFRGPVLALVEAVDDRVRLDDAGVYHPEGPTDYEALLRRLVVDESQTLSELAEHQLRTVNERAPVPPQVVESVVSLKTSSEAMYG